jgi:AraC family transcriptional regulator, transcriptional activator of pobA
MEALPVPEAPVIPVHVDEHTVDKTVLPDFKTTLTLHSIHRRRVRHPWHFPEHKHDQLVEMNIVLDGCQCVTIEGETFEQQEGELLFILSQQKHASHIHPDSSTMTVFCMHFHIDDPLFQTVIQELQPIYASDSPFTKQLRPILDRLIIISQRAMPMRIVDRMQLQSSIYELFSSMVNCLYEEELHTQDQYVRSLAHDIAEHLYKVLEQGFVENGSRAVIQQITKKLGISSSHCHRIFQQVYGQSPRQFLSSLKLWEAKRQLLHTSKPVAHISEFLGYQSMANFSRQFKRWTGQTPQQYRKNH